MKECPNCLGTKEMYNGEVDELVKCTFCKGEGKVSKDKFQLYDPIGYMLDNDSSLDTFIDE